MKSDAALLSTILLALAGCSGQKDDPWNVQTVNARLGRGVNLGNALDSPRVEGAWGLTLDEKYFTLLAERGFQSVRLPVRFSDHMLPSEPYTVDAQFLARVDWAVGCARKNGLSIVLDVHHFDDLTTDPAGHKAMWLALWEQLAPHYADEGPFLVFEPLNEPKDALTSDVWNQLIAEVVPVIRRTNPRRAIIVGGADFSHAADLETLVLPADDHVIAAVHFYDPFTFTHQGANWVSGASDWLGNIFRDEEAYTAPLTATLDAVSTWQTRTGRAVTVGEFGSIVLADPTSRAIHAAFVAREVTRRGWSFAYWNFGSDFAIYDTTKDDFVTDMAEALLTPEAILGRPVTASPDPVPPEGPSVLVDDFEDSLGDPPEQGAIAAALAQARGIPFDQSPGNWLPFANVDTTLTAADGTVLDSAPAKDYLASPFNTALAIAATGHPGHSFHMNIHLKGDQYPYAGVLCPFIGWWKDGEYDLGGLTAISFWARGKGAMRAALVPYTVVHDYPPSDQWGLFGNEFVVGPDWHRYVITADQLVPKRYSVQEAQGLTWDQVRDRVGAIHFEVGQSYGQEVDTHLELELDEIRLHGISLDVFVAPDAGTPDGGSLDGG